MEILNFLLGTVDKSGEVNTYSLGVLSSAIIIAIILSYITSVCLILWNFAMANSPEEKSKVIKNWWGYKRNNVLGIYYDIMFHPLLSTMMHVVAFTIAILITKFMIVTIETAIFVPIVLLFLVPFTIVLFYIRSKNMKLKKVERKLTEK